MIFGGTELDYVTSGTYTPSWEDIGPALICSIISLLINVFLIGSATIYSRKMATAWIVWHVIMVFIYWAWLVNKRMTELLYYLSNGSASVVRYSYSQLKYHGYIEFAGMKGCYFCQYSEASQIVGTSGAVGSGN